MDTTNYKNIDNYANKYINSKIGDIFNKELDFKENILKLETKLIYMEDYISSNGYFEKEFTKNIKQFLINDIFPMEDFFYSIKGGHQYSSNDFYNIKQIVNHITISDNDILQLLSFLTAVSNTMSSIEEFLDYLQKLIRNYKDEKKIYYNIIIEKKLELKNKKNEYLDYLIEKD